MKILVPRLPLAIAAKLAGTLLLLATACAPRVRAAGHSLQQPSPPMAEEGAAPQASRAPRAEIQSSLLGQQDPPIPTRPLFARIPDEGTLIGDAGGIALEAVSATAHWVAYCASTDGSDVSTTVRGTPLSEVELFLQVGKDKTKIDALLAIDPSGRYVIIEQDRRPWLIDTHDDTKRDLSGLDPDMQRDALPDHRSFAFADSALLVLQTPHRGSLLPLPLAESADLGGATTVEWGPQPAWRVLAQGTHLMARTLPVGATSGAWPVPPSDVPQHRCKSPHGAFAAYSKTSAYHPDPDLQTSLIDMSTHGTKGSARSGSEALHLSPAPGFVMPFRKGWVRRQESGRLLFVGESTQKQIASARCGARILHADERTGFFLISCEEYTPVFERPSSSSKKKRPKYRFDLYLVRPGYVRSLHADVARTGVDVHGPEGVHLLPLRPGSDGALVDFDTRTLRLLPEGSYVLTTGSEQALLRRNNRLWVWTKDGETPLQVDVSDTTPIAQAPGVTVVGNTLYFFRERLVEKSLPGPPLWVTTSGHTLISKEAGTSQRWPRGPLLLLPPPTEPSPEKTKETEETVELANHAPLATKEN